MYFKFSGRYNPLKKQNDCYYRLVESYRDNDGQVKHQTILNIGFIEEEVKSEELNQIARILTDRVRNRQSLFEEILTPLASKWVEDLWVRIIKSNKVDLGVFLPNSRKVDIDTIEHKEVREIGAEWLSYNIWQELRIDTVLEKEGFTEEEIKFAQTQIISRAIYPASEYATSKWIKENSAICDLTGFATEKINKDRLYRGTQKLYNIRHELESHLSQRTNELFDINDKIMIYDLTNTYFEGEKRKSKIAKHGRSKEKRSDAKIVVMALVVNMYGFIKHSSIHEGNFSDSSDIESVLKNIKQNTGLDKAIVVIDAGIATEANLEMIRSKGYDYLCVSRKKIRNYQYDTDRLTTYLETKSGKEVILKKVISEDNSDFIVEVVSDSKRQKEESMKNQYEQRFEQGLQNIKDSLGKKGGVKQIDKVNQRIGRLKERYPSVHQYYNIKLAEDEKTKLATDMTWEKEAGKVEEKEAGLGKYFLRTSLDMKDEVIVWNVYNTIREIEMTFRVLKTDLELRPIYHHNDEMALAHLHLGLLAYWIVNTIRVKLKLSGINYNWQEIVRIANTQKVVETTGVNTAGNEITVRKCSKASEKLQTLQAALKIKNKPYRRLEMTKSVVHRQPPNFKQRTHSQLIGPP